MVMREELQEDLLSSECSVIKRTISYEMPRKGLKSQRPKKTLHLKRHGDACLKFIKKHKETKNSFLERVLWTDETKTELLCHNYQNHELRKDGEAYLPKNTVSTIKFGGGSLIIWGCFSAKGVCKISEIIFTNPSARAGYDTRSIFKRSLTGLNSEYSFS